MLWEKLAENRIQEALENGELTPPPSGTSLDLEAYFSNPVEDRMALGLLKSAEVVPPEVTMMQEIARLEEALAAETDEGKAATVRTALQSQQVHLALLMERRRRMRREQSI